MWYVFFSNDVHRRRREGGRVGESTPDSQSALPRNSIYYMCAVQLRPHTQFERPNSDNFPALLL